MGLFGGRKTVNVDADILVVGGASTMTRGGWIAGTGGTNLGARAAIGEEVYPLAPGHDERIALNQVIPLLVHVILFGAGYVSRLRAAVERYVPVR